MADTGWNNPHPMERSTDLYIEIAICESFGKWPSEFDKLTSTEQKTLKRYYLLKNGKELYASLTKEDKFRFFSIWWGAAKR
jgi:hypothetical protein